MEIAILFIWSSLGASLHNQRNLIKLTGILHREKNERKLGRLLPYALFGHCVRKEIIKRLKRWDIKSKVEKFVPKQSPSMVRDAKEGSKPMDWFCWFLRILVRAFLVFSHVALPCCTHCIHPVYSGVLFSFSMYIHLIFPIKKEKVNSILSPLRMNRKYLW